MPKQFDLVFRSRGEWTTSIQRVHGASAQVPGISLSVRKPRLGSPVHVYVCTFAYGFFTQNQAKQ